MKRISSRVTLATATFAVLLSACGGPELGPPVETMIDFEATWQCDVTRFTFASAQEIDDKREEIQVRFGVSDEDHKTFVGMVQDDAGLRDAVATRVDTTCPATS